MQLAASTSSATYLLKDAPADEFFEAVRAAAENRTALAPSVAALLVARLRTPAEPAAFADLPALSPRAKDVLTLVA